MACKKDNMNLSECVNCEELKNELINCNDSGECRKAMALLTSINTKIINSGCLSKIDEALKNNTSLPTNEAIYNQTEILLNKKRRNYILDFVMLFIMILLIFYLYKK